MHVHDNTVHVHAEIIPAVDEATGELLLRIWKSQGIFREPYRIAILLPGPWEEEQSC